MPPKLPDFANISERLRKALRLEHRIVVIGLSDTPPANLPHYEGEPLKACQMLDTVRFEGKSFYTVQNDHYECKNAIRWLGFDESYEGHFSGEWATGDKQVTRLTAQNDGRVGAGVATGDDKRLRTLPVRQLLEKFLVLEQVFVSKAMKSRDELVKSRHTVRLYLFPSKKALTSLRNS